MSLYQASQKRERRAGAATQTLIIMKACLV